MWISQNKRTRFFLSISTFILSCAFLSAHIQAQTPDDFQSDRERMVRNQIAGSLFGREPVRDNSVLDAMRKVPRHKFVPDQYKNQAYSDTPLPIAADQTISQPYIVAFMTEALQPKPGSTILEIGTGSGYQAAVLAEIVKQVYTVEIIPELGKQAAELLTKLDYKNIQVRVGDGYLGWKEHAPYDGIIVTAAPDHIPAPLLEQLKPGGRLVIPVGPEGATQTLLVIQKRLDGTFTRQERMLVRFVPFTGEQHKNKSIKR